MIVATAGAPAAAVQRGRRLAIDRERGWRWLMLAPVLLLLTGLTVLPLLELLVLSVSNVTWRNARPVLSLAGLTNFAALIHDSLFLTSVRNTLVFVAVAVAIEIAIGLWRLLWHSARSAAARMSTPPPSCCPSCCRASSSARSGR